MRLLPSSRKLRSPATLLFVTAAAIYLYLKAFETFRNGLLDYIIVRSSFRSNHAIIFEASLSPQTSLEDRFLAQYHSTSKILPINPHVADILSKCKHKPNNHTNHIRLSNVSILNISMVPSAADTAGDDFKNNKYFNPAIISLPSYVSSTSSTPYQYLLVSRLVTSGTHQESHICFANICAPPGTLPGSPCTDDDLTLLGPAGGMRCVTRPEKVNIPATPAKRCTGAWKIFPDIPGFHDPRIFWSGRGEPLIEVNSGSEYGCIGLWMQDLRSVFPPLEEILMRKPNVEEHEDGEEGDEEKDGETIDVSDLGVRMGYPRLKELTRNPRESRADVEKNWIVFFPSEDEMWVQYNAMGKVEHRGYKGPHLSGQILGNSTVELSNNDEDKRAAFEEASQDDMFSDIGLSRQPFHNQSIHEEQPGLTKSSTSDIFHLSRLATSAASTVARRTAIFQASSGAISSTDLNNTTPNTSHLNHPPNTHSHRPFTPSHPGRTLSQLTSHAHTTKNLTSPFEPPCFNLSSPAHTADPLNNTGHWHQGTNSLRLILCTRSSFRSRTCHSHDSSFTHSNPSDDPASFTWRRYEEYLRAIGMIVHFSIIHRKFTNEMDLPMRYERYVLLWEARRPFRILGVSAYPLVFGSERVRPWSLEEDLPDHQHGGQDENQYYFTYTPSIAWSHRPNDEDQHVHHERGHEDLGTGFLGERVVVAVGMDDVGMGVGIVGVEELMGCLRGCEGG